MKSYVDPLLQTVSRMEITLTAQIGRHVAIAAQDVGIHRCSSSCHMIPSRTSTMSRRCSKPRADALERPICWLRRHRPARDTRQRPPTGQPELKHVAVRLSRESIAWAGVLISRRSLRPTGFVHWSRHAIAGGWTCDPCGTETPDQGVPRPPDERSISRSSPILGTKYPICCSRTLGLTYRDHPETNSFSAFSGFRRPRFARSVFPS